MAWCTFMFYVQMLCVFQIRFGGMHGVHIYITTMIYHYLHAMMANKNQISLVEILFRFVSLMWCILSMTYTGHAPMILYSDSMTVTLTKIALQEMLSVCCLILRKILNPVFLSAWSWYLFSILIFYCSELYWMFYKTLLWDIFGAENVSRIYF